MLKHEYPARWLTSMSAVVILAAGLLLLLSAISPVQAAAPSLSVSVTKVTNTSVSLSWTLSGSSGTLRYYWVVYGVVGSATSYSKNANRVTYANIVGLTPGTTYWFQVKAATTGGLVTSPVINQKTTGGTPDPQPTPPADPAGLAATATSATSISLQWADNSSDETGFKIERAPGTSGSFVQIDTVGAGVTSYSNTGLTAQTTYQYRVCAYNSVGNSGYSNTATATTPAPPAPISMPPADPTGLFVTAVSSNSVSLQWADNSSDETGFKIERAPSAGGAFTQIATVGAGVTGYSNTGLAAATAYCYRVCAYNTAGNSGFTNTACATTSDIVPIAPANLAATVVSSSRIDLQWADNASNESGFKVERAPTPAGPFTQIAAPGANVTSYSNTGLTASTTYYYRVCAWNAAGDSAYVTASATTAGTAPSAPGNFTAKVISTSRIDLSWSDNSDNETGFKLLRTAPDAKVTTFMLPANAVSYSDTGLTPSSTYAYQVCAYNAVGSSAYASANATTQALPPTPPSAPEGLAAAVISDSEIQLSWRDTSWNETGFIIESLPSGASDFLEIARLPAGSETYSHQGLGEASQHCYRVCAVNDGGQSGYTAIVSATTELKPPSNLAASAASCSTVNLTWTDNSAREANYVVERSTQGASGPWGALTTLAANSTSYADQTCQPRTTYHYRVFATGSISDYSNVESVVTPDLPIQPQWVGKTPVIGEAYWVAMSGPYAYITSSTGLQVVDISDPSNPLVKGSVDMTCPYDVATSGDGYVYVGSSKSLKVVDVQDPTSPAEVASLTMPDYAQGVCVSGNRAYVACYTAGLVIVDITMPNAPQVLGSMDTPGYAYSVSVAGDLAVVADSTSALIVDVANPASASIVSSVATNDRAVDVAIGNGYAYVAACTAGLIAIDLQQPTACRITGLGTPTLLGYVLGVALNGDYAFAATYSYLNTDSGLQVFDLSNSAEPVNMAFAAVPGRIRGGVAVENGVACMASGVGGITTLDVSQTGGPVQMASMPQIIQSRSLLADGSYLYALSYSSVNSHLYVFNMESNPWAPAQIGNLVLESPYDMALGTNGSAYIADSKSLKVVDLRDPTAPIVVAELAMPDYAQGVYVSGHKAYVACYTAGLVIVDITNPYTPRVVGGVDTPGTAFSVAVSGNTAVVADGSSVLIMDVTDPTSATIVGSVMTSDRAVDVAIDGGYAYVAACTAGLLAVDLVVPASPRITGTGRTTQVGSASGVVLSGGRAFVACLSYLNTDNGLQVFDISDPAQPVQVAFLASPGFRCRNVGVSGHCAYLTDDRNLSQIAAF